MLLRFQYFFDCAVDIKGGVRYRIESSISGVSSYLGQNGQTSVLCSGVKFHFENSSMTGRSARTNVGQGQFAGFLFTIK